MQLIENSSKEFRAVRACYQEHRHCDSACVVASEHRKGSLWGHSEFGAHLMCVQKHMLLNLGWKPLKAARTMNSRDEGFHCGIVLPFCIQIQGSSDKGRPFLVGREQREDWRLDESKGTD